MSESKIYILGKSMVKMSDFDYMYDEYTHCKICGGIDNVYFYSYVFGKDWYICAKCRRYVYRSFKELIGYEEQKVTYDGH